MKYPTTYDTLHGFLLIHADDDLDESIICRFIAFIDAYNLREEGDMRELTDLLLEGFPGYKDRFDVERWLHEWADEDLETLKVMGSMFFDDWKD